MFNAIASHISYSYNVLHILLAMNTALQFFREFEANYPEILHSCYIVNGKNLEHNFAPVRFVFVPK